MVLLGCGHGFVGASLPRTPVVAAAASTRGFDYWDLAGDDITTHIVIKVINAENGDTHTSVTNNIELTTDVSSQR